MNAKNAESVNLWTKAPVANLVRYEPSGIYFARAKVRGKLIRKSLDTNILSVAKLRLADMLDAEHRAIAPSQTKIVGKMTFGDALAIFKERQKHATEIKERTKEYNGRAGDALLKTWSGLEQMDVKRITKFDCLEWRAEHGTNAAILQRSGRKPQIRSLSQAGRSCPCESPFCLHTNTARCLVPDIHRDESTDRHWPQPEAISSARRHWYRDGLHG